MASADGENGGGIGGDAEPQLSLSASPSLSGGDGPGGAATEVEQRAPRREQKRGEEDEEPRQSRCVKKGIRLVGGEGNSGAIGKKLDLSTSLTQKKPKKH